MTVNLLCTRTSKYMLAQLFGRSVATIEKWTEAGMPMNKDGSYMLWRCVSWRERQVAEAVNRRLQMETLSQDELCRLLNISRQTLWSWGRNEKLPRNRDKTYNLRAVCQWLPGYYRRHYGRRFRKTMRTLQEAFNRVTKWTKD